MKQMFLTWCMTVTLSLGMLATTGAKAQQANDEVTSFHHQLDQFTSKIINADPELRSMLGLKDDGIGDLSHLMSDVSLPRRAQLRAEFEQALKALAEFDRDTLEGQERWSHDMASWLYRTQLDLLAFDWAPAWMPGGGSVYAVDQLFSIPVMLPQFMQNHHGIVDKSDAQNYIARLKAIAKKLDQVRANFDMQAEMWLGTVGGRYWAASQTLDTGESGA